MHRRTTIRHGIILAGVILLGGDAWATCAPEQMVKVVVRDATPGVDPGSFAAQPRTFYRLGTRYGRTEEVPDPEHGMHGLIVVSEPDAWRVTVFPRPASG
jgi:hypothetical protein